MTCRKLGQELDNQTLEWLSGLSDALHRRVARAGLCEPRKKVEEQHSLTVPGSCEEFAGGVLNLISWPMMFLSGVWFSLDTAHPYLQIVAQVLPLTHLVQGLREIMLNGAGFAQTLPNLLAMLGITTVCISISAARFSWGED